MATKKKIDINPHVFRSAYSPRERKPFSCDGESLTQQSAKDSCDINKILAGYNKTGLVTHINRRPGLYDDISHITDYAECYNKILLAQEAFDTLPAKVRKKFNNDPEAFVAFVSNPDNLEEMKSLGLSPSDSSVEVPSTVEVEVPAASDNGDEK